MRPSIAFFQSTAIVTENRGRSRNTEVHLIEVLHVRHVVSAQFARLADADWTLASKEDADDRMD